MSRNSDGRKIPGRTRLLSKLGAKALRILEAVGEGLVSLELSQRRQRIFVSSGWEGIRRVARADELRAYRKRARRLAERGLIETRVVGRRLACSLTPSGEETLLRHTMSGASRRSDGKSIYVIFDVPERERGRRNQLRHFLKSVGFARVQQSVWVTRRDVYREFKLWVERHALGRWVAVLLAERD